jgi:hypothetical protein
MGKRFLSIYCVNKFALKCTTDPYLTLQFYEHRWCQWPLPEAASKGTQLYPALVAGFFYS